MKDPCYPKLIAAVAAVLVTTSCATHRERASAPAISGESVVLAGEEPARLAFLPAGRMVEVRSTYLRNQTNTVQFELGRDFVFDDERGEIRRTTPSRIPDFRTNMLFGVDDFDHSKYPGFGNTRFFAFVDYSPAGDTGWPNQPLQLAHLQQTQTKLRSGGPLKIVAFGDSITAGGDATSPDLVFWKRWADALQKKYPSAQVTAINGATGGDRTHEGLIRLQEKVISQKPDLVLIGFGMNDHNIGGFGVTLDTFKQNLATIIDRIRMETGAEVILYSTFPPNPKWHYGSKNMEAYARATEAVAREKQCAFADVYGNWISYASRKKPEDLLGNNINHPNDFGHWLYFAVLNELGL